jgi:hypothetical protein
LQVGVVLPPLPVDPLPPPPLPVDPLPLLLVLPLLLAPQPSSGAATPPKATA